MSYEGFYCVREKALSEFFTIFPSVFSGENPDVNWEYHTKKFFLREIIGVMSQRIKIFRKIRYNGIYLAIYKDS